MSPGAWVDGHACNALCHLILCDDRREAPSSRPRLPKIIWSQHVAPFLQFRPIFPGMMYVFGGRTKHAAALDIVEMFDPWDGAWVACPPMPHRRVGAAAVEMPDGRLLVVGGYDMQGHVRGILASCDVYDPKRGRWEAGGVAPLRRARWGHACAVVEGKVLAAGGCSLEVGASPEELCVETLRSCEVYDPEVGKWEEAGPLAVPRAGLRMVSLGPQLVAAVGGCEDVFGHHKMLGTIELYDAPLRRWLLLDSGLERPRSAAAVAGVGGLIFAAGGARGGASAELSAAALPALGRKGESQPNYGDDSAVADLPGERVGSQAALLPLVLPGSSDGLAGKRQPMQRRCVLVVGGERPRVDGGREQLDSVLAYDLEARAWLPWATVPPMRVPRSSMALCLGAGCSGSE